MKHIILSVYILTSQCLISSQEKKEKPLNIVMIAIDDMNNWAGGWQNEAYTPNIEYLAKSGIQFKNAHCVVPACNPSRVALLTGQRPETTGQYTNEGNFRDLAGGLSRLTLPQYLKQHGYETIESGKIFHHPAGTKAEPSHYSDPASWTFQFKNVIGTPGDKLYYDENGWAKWLNGCNEYEGLPLKDYIRKHGIWGPIPQSKEECGDWRSARFCADYLEKKHEKPFLLACGIFRPHSPQLAPQEYFDKYPLNEIILPNVPLNDMDDIPEIALTNWSTGFARKLMSDSLEWKKAIQAYKACMSFADDCVGELLNSLENSEYKDNTIIILWTDHGWQLGHKNRWEKFSLWNQSTNSPMVIKLPLSTQSLVIDKPVSFLDIYPTLIHLLGMEIPDFLEGHSLVPLMNNPLSAWPHAVVITYQEGNNSIRKDNWNYIRYEDGTEELYDQSNDPNEFKNLAGQPQYREIMQQLINSLPKVSYKQAEKVPGG